MTTADFDEVYAGVPVEQRQMLAQFRASHPYKELDIDGARWRYIACGQGDRALLFLPGGFLAADMWFYSILALEQDYRIVAPDAYTLQGTFAMDEVCQALLRILDAEGIDRAPALYAAGVDNYRLARTRDLVVLALRAMREGFRVLQAKGLPVTPPKLRVIQWLPEPLLVLLAQRLLSNPLMETALVKHAEAARDEVQHLIGEFMALARTTPVPTPTIDALLEYRCSCMSNWKTCGAEAV